MSMAGLFACVAVAGVDVTVDTNQRILFDTGAMRCQPVVRCSHKFTQAFFGKQSVENGDLLSILDQYKLWTIGTNVLASLHRSSSRGDPGRCGERPLDQLGRGRFR